jgi:neutral ceramidase
MLPADKTDGRPNMRVGTSRVRITPALPFCLAGHKAPRRAHFIGDHLYARALVASDDRQTIAIISVDLLWLSRDQCMTIRRIVAENSCICKHQVMICCSHTHSGPDTLAWYQAAPPIDRVSLSLLLHRIARAATAAAQKLVQVTVSHNHGHCPIGINRRRHVNDRVLRLPNPTGPVDHTLSVVSFISCSGTVVAAIMHHSTHPAVLGQRSHLVSGDWCGLASYEVERRMGCTCLYLNGPSGDVNPIIGVGRAYEEALKLAKSVAATAVSILAAPAKPMCTTNTIDAVHQDVSGPGHSHPYLTKYQDHRMSRRADMVCEVQVIRLGPVIIAGMPGEALIETGRAVAASNSVLVVSGANDYVGYLPLPHIVREGGYEAATRMLAEETIEAVVFAARSLTEERLRQPHPSSIINIAQTVNTACRDASHSR